MQSGSCGENLMWTLDDEGTLIIGGTGEMEDFYIYECAPWYNERESIKKIIIENGVTTIGDQAFYYYRNLTSVTIGNSVKTIGEYAFNSCENLTSVTIPDSVTTIGEGAFEGCFCLEMKTFGCRDNRGI